MGMIGITIVFALFLILGILVGHEAGRRLAARARNARTYWAYNALVIVIGMVISFAVALFTLYSMLGFAIGFIGGGIAGLKMGWGRSEGLWARHDAAFLVNAGHLERSKREEALREGGDAGEGSGQLKPDPERELISVMMDDTADGRAASQRK